LKAVILAGGKGTRLQPYTTVFPKPLVPLGEKPILDIIVRQLSHYGFKDIILTVGHLAELIQAYFQHLNGQLASLNISYYKEKKPLGTAGSLASIPKLDETFLVMNGDILTSLDYAKLMRYHLENQAMLTVAMFKKRVKIDLGVLDVNEQGFLTKYIEKPEKEYLVSMGIYVYEPTILKYITPNKYLDFPDLVIRLLKHDEKVAGYLFDDYWLDIGREEDYKKAQEEFELMKDKFVFYKEKK